MYVGKCHNGSQGTTPRLAQSLLKNGPTPASFIVYFQFFKQTSLQF